MRSTPATENVARDARAVKSRGRVLWPTYPTDPASALEAPMPRTMAAHAREFIARFARAGKLIYRLVHKGRGYPLHPSEIDHAISQRWSLMAPPKAEIVPIDADGLAQDRARALCAQLDRGVGYPSGGYRAFVDGKWWPLPHRRYVTLARDMGYEVVEGMHIIAVVGDDQERVAVAKLARSFGADARLEGMTRIPTLPYPTIRFDLTRAPRHKLERVIQEDLRRRLSYRGLSLQYFDSADLAESMRAFWTPARSREVLETLRAIEPWSGQPLWTPNPSADWQEEDIVLPPTHSWQRDDRRWDCSLEWYSARGDAATVAEIEERRSRAALSRRAKFDEKHSVVVDAARRFLAACEQQDRRAAIGIADEVGLSVARVAVLTDSPFDKVRRAVAATLGVRPEAAEDELLREAWEMTSETTFERLPRPRWNAMRLERVRQVDRTVVYELRQELRSRRKERPGESRQLEDRPPVAPAEKPSIPARRSTSDLDAAIREIEESMLKRGYDPSVDRSAPAYLTLGELRRRGFVDPEPISSWVAAYGAESTFLAAYVTERESGLPHPNPRRGPQRFEHDWNKKTAQGRWWKQEARSREAVEQTVAAERALVGRKRKCLSRAASTLGPFLDAKPTLAGALHVLLALCVEKGRPAPGYRAIQKTVGCKSLSTVALFIEVLIDLGLISKAGPIRKGWPDLRAQEFEILLPSDDEILTALYGMYPDLADYAAPVRRRVFDLGHLDWLDSQLIEHVQSASPSYAGDEGAVAAATIGRAPPTALVGAQQRINSRDTGRLIDQVRAMRDAGLPSGFLVRAASAVLGVGQREVLAQLATGARTMIQLAALVGDEGRLVGKAWSIVVTSQHDSEREKSRLDVRKLAMELGGRSDAEERRQADELWAMLKEVGEVEPRFSDDVVDKARTRLLLTAERRRAA